MTWTRRSARTGHAELGATAVSYALMAAIVALLLSVGFMLLHGGVAADLRRSGNCLVSLDTAGGCPPPGGGSGGSPGPPPGKTTTTSSSTTSTTSTTTPS
jgi:Flp pilus assembly pilin Flp